jgi:hypothetical protein
MSMMHVHKISPRKEYLQQQKQRVLDSISLAEKFPKLKSLTVDLGYFGPEGITKNSQVKYTVNLEHAKAIFCFGCHNHECVRGDFDLSDVLVEAVAARRRAVSGEVRCLGWRNRASIDTVPCHNLLRYKLTLKY